MGSVCCPRKRDPYEEIVNCRTLPFDRAICSSLFNVGHTAISTQLPHNDVRRSVFLYETVLQLDNVHGKIQTGITIFSIEGCSCVIDLTLASTSENKKVYRGMFTIYPPKDIFTDKYSYEPLYSNACSLLLYPTHFQLALTNPSLRFDYFPAQEHVQILHLSLIMFPMAFISWPNIADQTITDLQRLGFNTPLQLLSAFRGKYAANPDLFVRFLNKHYVRYALLLVTQITQWYRTCI